jgi:hypothetical protein
MPSTKPGTRLTAIADPAAAPTTLQLAYELSAAP